MSEALKLDDVVLELDYEQEPTISSQDLAEGHLRYLAYWQRQRQEREHQGQDHAEIQREERAHQRVLAHRRLPLGHERLAAELDFYLIAHLVADPPAENGQRFGGAYYLRPERGIDLDFQGFFSLAYVAYLRYDVR